MHEHHGGCSRTARLQRFLFCLVISLLLLPLAGCGYSLAGRGSFLPADIKVIGVPLFKNNTNLFEFERRVTDKVRSELIGRGKYRVEPTADNVDAILIGEINSVYLAPAAFNQQVQATRYVLTLTANIEFRSVKDNKVLWSNPSMQFRDEFDVTTTVQATDAAVFLGQDANALERLSIEFARAISLVDSRGVLMSGPPPATVRQQIAARTPDPLYLIVGDDEAEMSRLTSDISGLVEDELRAFNLERLYANEKAVTPSTIVEAARTMPMLGDRRVVIVLRAERLLKPKRKVKGQEETGGGEEEEAPDDLDVLEEYVKRPEPYTTLVLVAADVDRQRKIYKALQKSATIVEFWGLRASRDARVDLRDAARTAEQLVRKAVGDAGQQIDPAAAKLIAQRAGTDIARLRGDVDRLLLYAAGKPKISLQDVQEVVSGETSQDDWAVTNAISRGDTAEALRQLGLALDAGGVSYQILGQLAWFVREKFPSGDPKRVRPAVEALFRTDLDLKSSGGDPRVLLERLVVELCAR